MKIEITTDEARGDSRAFADGAPAGRLGFRIDDRASPPVWTLYTTVVEHAYEGHGVGSALVRDVVGRAETAGARVNPTCWFVAGWIERHPEHHGVLSGGAG